MDRHRGSGLINDAQAAPTLARPAAFGVVRALVADEIGRLRRRSVPASEWARWDGGTRLDEDGVGVDSVDRLAVVRRVAAFFDLPALGTDDHLVIGETLGDWTDVVCESLRLRFERLCFETSGSTGAPKTSHHAVGDLWAETDALAQIYGAVRRIWLFVPPHHIFGFLHGPLLAARRGAELIDARAMAPTALGRLQAGDLAIATPFLWTRLLDATPEIPPGVVGGVSGAPATAELFDRARMKGLSRLIEVYGSTETGGVGWRDGFDDPFRLFAGWTRRGPEQLARARAPQDTLATPDRLAWSSPVLFRPAGRRDKVVQVAGVNVSLDGVRQAMAAHPLVEDCAVRVDAADPDGRLKAFVAIKTPEIDGALDALAAHAAATLPAPARPVSITIGGALPVDAMGKSRDWTARPNGS